MREINEPVWDMLRVCMPKWEMVHMCVQEPWPYFSVKAPYEAVK